MANLKNMFYHLHFSSPTSAAFVCLVVDTPKCDLFVHKALCLFIARCQFFRSLLRVGLKTRLDRQLNLAYHDERLIRCSLILSKIRQEGVIWVVLISQTTRVNRSECVLFVRSFFIRTVLAGWRWRAPTAFCFFARAHIYSLEYRNSEKNNLTISFAKFTLGVQKRVGVAFPWF